MSTTKSTPWVLVLAACLGAFAAMLTANVRSPFLPDMARELSVSLSSVANLFGLTSAAWGAASYLTGYMSHRYGRGRLIILSLLFLSFSMASVAFVKSYSALAGITIFAGICGGLFTAAVLTEVSLRTPLSHQGRALGYVLAGQTLTLLIGVPVAAWLGAKIGWRGIHFALAGITLFAVVFMFVGLRKSKQVPEKKDEAPYSGSTIKRALTGPITRLFLALIAERICFGLAIFYYASFLRTQYDIPVEAVAFPLMGFALGNLTGTFLGGQLADRFLYRRISYATLTIIAGGIAALWFAWRPGIGTTISLGFIFALLNGMAKPPLLAALADVPVDVRGTVMGLNISIGSIGWLIAAFYGGWLYERVGFVGFSPLMAAMCLLSAVVLLPDYRLGQQQRQ